MDFQSLPEPERNYNLQMSGETLKWVCDWGPEEVSLWEMRGSEEEFYVTRHCWWCLRCCHPAGHSWRWVATLVWVTRKRKRISRRSSCPRRMVTSIYLVKYTNFLHDLLCISEYGFLSPLAMWWPMDTSLPPLTSTMSNWHPTRTSLWKNWQKMVIMFGQGTGYGKDGPTVLSR